MCIYFDISAFLLVLFCTASWPLDMDILSVYVTFTYAHVCIHVHIERSLKECCTEVYISKKCTDHYCSDQRSSLFILESRTPELRDKGGNCPSCAAG